MDQDPITVSRRDLLKLAGAATAAGAAGGSLDLLRPGPAAAQTPKRGGTIRLAGFDPPHFDPHQTPHWWTFIYTSLTHGGLVRHKAGPSVTPGTLPIEPHLAESWERPNETTYVFKLRKGVRWHAKPPVNGRELTAEDVVFTFQRALTIKGNPNRAAFEEIDRVEALDRHTVRFTMKEPFSWFLESPALADILPKEAADKEGLFKSPETVIGTGPWMLERYEPNVRLSFVRNPDYFQQGLPYLDAIEFRDGHRPRLQARGLAERPVRLRPRDPYDLPALGPRGRQAPQAESADGGVHVADLHASAVPKLEAEPLRDVRVRRALLHGRQSHGSDQGEPHGLRARVGQSARPRRAHGVGDPDRPADAGGPAALRGRSRWGPAPAGPGGAERAQVPRESSGTWGTAFSDVVQAILSEWKRAGIETELKLKEGNAFIASSLARNFEKMIITLRGGATTPDPYLMNLLPGRPQNIAGVNDPKLNEMILLQRRTFDEKKRREIIFDIQRHFAQQAYQLFVSPAARVISAWEPYVRNFMPNIGNDYGGRLMGVWLDR